MKEIAEFLKKKDNYLILTHHNADVDAVASAVVLRDSLVRMGKKARVGVPESVSEVARNFLREELETDPEVRDEKIIVVDTSAPEQLEPVKIEKADVVIDHHIQGNIKSGLSYVEPEAKSCSELVYMLCGEMGTEITPEMATLLTGGIIYDTAHFRRAGPETFVLVAELLKKADRDYQKILSMLRTETDISEKIAIFKSMKRLRTYRAGEALVCITSVGSFEASVARNLLRLGADVAIVGAPKKKGLRISGRMNWALREKLNLAEIFAKTETLIGGSAGGHDVAASANGKNPENMGKALNLILREIENRFGKAKEL